MIKDNRNNEDKMLEIGAFAGAILGLACAYFLTGCSASGYTIEAKLGAHAVDERNTSEITQAKSRPLACAWNPKYCGDQNDK